MAQDSGIDNQMAIAALAVGGVAALVLGLHFLYGEHQGPINHVLIEIFRALLWPFTPFSEAAVEYRARAGEGPPERFSGEAMWAHYGFVMEYWRWVIAPMLVVAGVALWWGDAIGRFRRRLDLLALMRLQAEVSPTLRPVLPQQTGRWPFRRVRTMLDEPLDHGPWMTARQPIQWVADHGLLREQTADGSGESSVVAHSELIDRRTGMYRAQSPLWQRDGERRRQRMFLDRSATAERFREQLGSAMPGSVLDLDAYKRGLAAAFGLMAVGDKASQNHALSLVDAMAASWRQEAPTEIDIADADKVLPEVLAADQVAPYLAAHDRYERVWLVALVHAQQASGSLPPAMYRWLRVTDRTLWYALHNVGMRARRIEAAAVLTHWSVEERAGIPLGEPQVEPAIDALDQHLREEGWIVVPETKRTQPSLAKRGRPEQARGGKRGAQGAKKGQAAPHRSAQ